MSGRSRLEQYDGVRLDDGARLGRKTSLRYETCSFGPCLEQIDDVIQIEGILSAICAQ